MAERKGWDLEMSVRVREDKTWVEEGVLTREGSQRNGLAWVE